MSIFEKIFSVKQLEKHKQYCFLGIKIKVPSKKIYDNRYQNLPIQNNKIIFRTSSGAYTCNPKYIAQEILNQNLNYDLVWVVNKNILKYINDFPKEIRLVMEDTLEDYKEQASAKIWIDNERRMKYVKEGFNKRPEQIYIQTFHGSIGIKKVGIDRTDINPRASKNPRRDAEQIDYLTSNGKFTTDVFKRIFWDNGKILEIGHPRNDIFFYSDEQKQHIKNKVFEKYNIPADKKFVLYAPTLREDKDTSCLTLDYEQTAKALSEKFGGEWFVMVRLHPLIIELKENLDLVSENIIDATEYSDIQELLTCADAVITDYSSCIYDYLLTGKPGFIYATDIAKYNNSRGLYYPLETTPFPIAQNNHEMIENIKNFDNEKYLNNAMKFIQEKGCVEKGYASREVVKLINEITGIS